MKNLKIWSLIALFAMVFVGCGGDDNDNLDQSGINGTWYLTSMCGSAPEFNVYIEFNNSGKFNIYQQVWTLTYERYTGTYSVDGNVITGKYSDGTAWTASYNYSVANSQLKLENVENSSEVSIYAAKPIPAEVIEEAITATRSEGVVPFL